MKAGQSITQGAAAALNAEANGVSLSWMGGNLLDAPPADVEVILAGDIFYEMTMAARFLDWLRGLNPPERAQPQRIVTAPQAMTDTEFPSISIINLGSNAELGARMGMALSPHRWRGNLWVEGWAPWAEFDLIGAKLRIGDAVLEVRERITRCNATKVDVTTGRISGDTLAALQAGYGPQDFGI